MRTTEEPERKIEMFLSDLGIVHASLRGWV
jgi:hypothetical protein